MSDAPRGQVESMHTFRVARRKEAEVQAGDAQIKNAVLRSICGNQRASLAVSGAAVDRAADTVQLLAHRSRQRQRVAVGWNKRLDRWQASCE